MDDPLFEYNQKHKRKRKRSKVNPASESEPSFTQLGEDLYQNDTTGIVFYRCPRCWMEFAMLKSFDQHKQQKHHQCNKCVREFIDPISLIKHQHSVHLRKQGLFRCPECGELFGNKFDFYQHEIRHCKINPLTCPMCSLSFVSERELDNHKLVHAGLLPFVCPECGKRFDNQRCLMRHQIAQHIILTDDFLCAVCGLLFSSKYQLDVHHQKDHLNIRKQFYCPDCTKSYFTAEALLKHRKKKHKTYSCTDCGKMFRKLCSLRMHDNLHKKQKRLALEQGLSKDQHDSSTTSDSPKVIKT